MAMDLDRSFGFLVHDVARLFGRRFNQRALLFLGLTRAQCKVLGYLARNEGINQAGLADLLEIKPMTLVRQIDRMEEDGWIERQPQPGDRRARRLVLTDKARPILARILDLSNEIRAESFAGLSKDDGKRLLELLRRVHGDLWNACCRWRRISPSSTRRPSARPVAMRNCRLSEAIIDDFRR